VNITTKITIIFYIYYIKKTNVILFIIISYFTSSNLYNFGLGKKFYLNLIFYHIIKMASFKLETMNAQNATCTFQPVSDIPVRIPDGLLIAAPITDDTIERLFNLIHLSETPIQEIMIVGEKGSTNLKRGDYENLKKLFNRNIELGGKVDIIPASETRKNRFPSNVPGKLGKEIRNLYIFQMCNMIGGTPGFKPDDAFTIRINTVNAQTCLLVLKKIDRMISTVIYERGLSLAFKYQEYLEKNGKFYTKEEGSTLSEMAKAGLETIEKSKEQMRKEVIELLDVSTPRKLNVTLAMIKFATQMILCNSTETIYKTDEFGIRNEDKFKPNFGERNIKTEAIIAMEKTLSEIEDLDLTPSYDLYAHCKLAKKFCSKQGDKTFKEMIFNGLVAKEPEAVEFDQFREIWIISDEGEEVDDEAAAYARMRTWKNCKICNFLIGGDFTPEQRLARVLSILYPM